MRPRFSRLSAGLRVGVDALARIAKPGDVPPRGVVDRMADLANPRIDLARVDPAIVAFFEDTAGLGLHVRSRWRFPMNVVWRLARPIMKWIGQFVYPQDEGRIVTTCFAIDTTADGRDDARAIVRRYDDGTPMQVVAYATWARAGTRYMSAAFPLPFMRVVGILRLDGIEQDDALAVRLTSSRRGDDDAGVWLAIGPFGIPAPFGERIDLYAARMKDAPREPPPSGLPSPTIIGRHEQRLFGFHFVTHTYWMWPLQPGQ